MTLTVTQQAPAQGDLVYFVAKGGLKRGDIPKEEFSGKPLQKLLLREDGRRVLYVGLGEKKGEDAVRQAAGVAARTLLGVGARTLVFDLGPWAAQAKAAVEGAMLGAYCFHEFRLPERQRKNHLDRLVLVADARRIESVRREAMLGQKLAEATNMTRALANLPGNVVTPAVLAERARQLARRWKLRCRVWDEKQLRRDGFGGILAVGGGSDHPPRLILLEYRGGRKSAAPVVIVGKGVTFDSGGVSIKPAANMEEMKFDKAGACAVLGIMQSVAALKLPVNVVGLIPSAENLLGARSYRPGDLVPTYDGKHVEVLNTDAEGRIILADALAYGRRHLRPRMMIDLATLTGACVVALGARRAGLFTDSESVREQLVSLGDDLGERVWPLPMGDEFEEQIRSEVGAYKNTGGRDGGACTAATFLRHWAEKTPWVHLDIAGPAWTTSDRPNLERGATGFGVRLVTEWLRAHA